jgi:hypothetical protein
LQTHEFKRLLKPLENRVSNRFQFGSCCHKISGLEAEEHWQGLRGGDQEKARTHYHHYLLLHVLFIIIHGHINANRANHSHYAGDGVTEFYHDGDVLGNLLGNGGQGGGSCLVVTGLVLREAYGGTVLFLVNFENYLSHLRI